jgi:uncharacterized protein YeeX (DUF496 family)
MKKLFFGLIATVLLMSNVNAQNVRAKFLEGKKSQKEVVDSYNKLSDQQQKELWLDKFSQLSKLNLPKEHLALINKLYENFKDGVDNNPEEDFFITASELAKITPAKDFGYMFERLEDYNYNNKFIDSKKLSDSYIIDLKNLNPFNNINDISARGNCSCRWCIGMGTTGTKCIVTEHGCGFLWLQSCNQCVFCL